MTTHLEVKETTFYEQLQNCPNLDLRSNQGKRLNLSYTLLCLAISLLRNRDGNLSSLHRSMENKNEELVAFLGVGQQKIVSRSHLPKILGKVSLLWFEKLLFDKFKVELSETEKEWFAGDGKELRGSIEKGDKRGEAIVQLVRHKDREVLGQAFYNGKKESEKPCLQGLIQQTEASNQKITTDALHLSPATTEPINQAGGIFLIGLKNNQKELCTAMKKYALEAEAIDQIVTTEKKHGRVERRSYFHYDISQQPFAERWEKTAFKSLFKVRRERYICKTEKESDEIDYYISNGKKAEDEDYFEAIRNHWTVEASNHVRDVTFKEDDLRTKHKPVSKVLAGLRTLAVKILGLKKPKNMVAQLELFSDKFQSLLNWLREINFI